MKNIVVISIIFVKVSYAYLYGCRAHLLRYWCAVLTGIRELARTRNTAKLFGFGVKRIFNAEAATEFALSCKDKKGISMA